MDDDLKAYSTVESPSTYLLYVPLLWQPTPNQASTAVVEDLLDNTTFYNTKTTDHASLGYDVTTPTSAVSAHSSILETCSVLLSIGLRLGGSHR